MSHYLRKKPLVVIVASAAFALVSFTSQAKNDELPDPAPRIFRQPIATAGDAPLTPFQGLSVDLSRRGDVVHFFRHVYRKTLDVPSDGTGNAWSCNSAIADHVPSLATITMINYFRAMAGLPGNVGLNTRFSVETKHAPVSRTGNQQPTTILGCPRVGSLELETITSLALGQSGAAGIVGYMRDEDVVDTSAARRRWILYPPLEIIGRVPTDSDNDFHSSSKNLWGSSNSGARPTTPEWVAWPPKGIVPYQVVFRRWSLSRNSLPGADFSGATVTMKADGESLDLEMLPVVTGIGDNTLVWEPSGLALGPGQRDQTITVEVENIVIDGVPKRLAYAVTVIDPEQSVVGNSGLGLYDPDDAVFTLTPIAPQQPGVSNSYSGPSLYTPDTPFLIPDTVDPRKPGVSDQYSGQGLYTPDTLFLIPDTVVPQKPGVSGPDPGQGLNDPDDAWYVLASGAVSAPAQKNFVFGPRFSAMLPVVGDWTENGQETVALYDQRQGTFSLRLDEENTGIFRFGKRNASRLPVAGNWDGRHGDTVGLYDPARSRFVLSSGHRTKTKYASFRFGRANAGWIPIAGDWDGDGSDSVGLYDPQGGRFLLKNRNRSGPADIQFRFGPKNSRHIPVAGDWDGDGLDTVGLYQPNSGRFLLKNRNTRGRADLKLSQPHDSPRSIPIAGKWNGRRQTQTPHYNYGVLQGTVEIVNTCGNVSVSMETECAPRPASIPLELQALSVAGPLQNLRSDKKGRLKALIEPGRYRLVPELPAFLNGSPTIIDVFADQVLRVTIRLYSNIQ